MNPNAFKLKQKWEHSTRMSKVDPNLIFFGFFTDVGVAATVCHTFYYLKKHIKLKAYEPQFSQHSNVYLLSIVLQAEHVAGFIAYKKWNELIIITKLNKPSSEIDIS
ncbi:hypothetical protein GQX74_002126 [Glossina fuscipes]|nr:hypothetical protein GQX74_002126 [Glossina fuscipes]